MTFALRLVVLGLAAYGAAGLAVSLVVARLTPLARRWRNGPASARATRLAWLQVLPAAAGMAALLLVISGLVLFEPRHGQEVLGRSLPLLALFASATLVAAGWKVWAIQRATHRTVRAWLATASPVILDGASAPAFAVDADFPIVAVVGLFRPRLVIARSVLDACTREELAAILAHEHGHVERRDNLRRLALRAVADPLGWTRTGAGLIDDWHEAIEDAADDDAWRAGPEGRLYLAQALITVARLAPSPVRETLLPASALYRGEQLDRRIRRLLDPAPHAAEAPRSRWLAPLVGLAVMAASVAALPAVYELVEAAVRLLP